MWTRDLIIKKIEELYVNVFTSNNFIQLPGSTEIALKNSYPWGYDLTAVPDIIFSPEHFSFGIQILRRHDYIEEIWEEYSELLGLQTTPKHTVNLNCNKADIEFINKNYSDGYGSFKFKLEEENFNDNLKIIRTFITNTILPKLASYEDLRNLDRIVNSSFEFNEPVHNLLNHEGLMFRRIAIAKFSDNKNYEDLCNYFRSTFDWYNENGKMEGQQFYLNYPIVFEKIYEKLKKTAPY